MHPLEYWRSVERDRAFRISQLAVRDPWLADDAPPRFLTTGSHARADPSDAGRRWP